MDGLYFIRSMLLLISALAESGLCVIGSKVQRRAADQQISVPTSISSDNVQKQTRTIRKLRIGLPQAALQARKTAFAPQLDILKSWQFI
jgi:hypothetical protein